jgi:hypothetical protein
MTHLVLTLPSRAQRRRGDNDNAMIVAALSTRHDRDCHGGVVIMTALCDAHARMHTSYRSLCATRTCPPLLHIRKLPYTYTGFKNGDLSKHMFLFLFLCFLPRFHIICV